MTMLRGMKQGLLGLALAVTTLGTAEAASATVTAIGPGAFTPANPAVTFVGVPAGTDVNGLSTGGITFSYLVAGTPTAGQVIITTGPGITNNLPVTPTAVSIGNSAGTLVMTLSSAVNQLGYGFALLSGSVIPNATTMSVFNGATLLGSLSFPGQPDPSFTGGFAGLRSTGAFNRVEVTFATAPAFAIGNIRYAVVPEPQTWALLLLGFGAAGTAVRARRQREARAA